MFYLDGTNIIEQRTDDTVLHFYYDSNDEIVGFKHNGNNYFYVKNLQGDITDIVNTSGEIVTSYTYDPWGKVLSVTGSNVELGNLNPFRYRSYYYDTDLGLYYLQSRYYDAETGRFINCDDVNFIGCSEDYISYNPFAYCENNPVNGWDPSGYSNVISFYKKYYSLIAAIVSLMTVVTAISSTGVINPTGVLVGAGVLVVGVAGIAIYANV